MLEFTTPHPMPSSMSSLTLLNEPFIRMGGLAKAAAGAVFLFYMHSCNCIARHSIMCGFAFVSWLYVPASFSGDKAEHAMDEQSVSLSPVAAAAVLGLNGGGKCGEGEEEKEEDDDEEQLSDNEEDRYVLLANREVTAVAKARREREERGSSGSGGGGSGGDDGGGGGRGGGDDYSLYEQPVREGRGGYGGSAVDSLYGQTVRGGAGGGGGSPVLRDTPPRHLGEDWGGLGGTSPALLVAAAAQYQVPRRGADTDEDSESETEYSPLPQRSIAPSFCATAWQGLTCPS